MNAAQAVRATGVLALLACTALTACDNTPVSAPQDASRGEARALDEAASMLDDPRAKPAKAVRAPESN